uniref:uncharacterized protein LOC122581203 n=1 Tax=Erigeron canadensis TaxID=72917 RepID=UPI001CB8E050|nr:uncharacterized protein LOC122581203 [Erigeron canadensis]
MGVKVGSGCFNWSQQPSISQQTLASSISSPSSKRYSLSDVTLICRGSSSFRTKLNRSRSCESLKTSNNKQHSFRRIVSANFDSEFLREIEEFGPRFHYEDQDFKLSDCQTDKLESKERIPNQFADRANWFGDIIPSDIERKANSLELPFSLRIIKKKKQWEEGFKEGKDSTRSSMKKAFSSMVFIIRELQSYTLQLREILFLEDLQEVLVSVQKEMNASFVWLFQQVFSHTPTLMVHVMILLANYSVYSMSNNVAFASPPPPATVETIIFTVKQQKDRYFDHSMIKVFSGDLGGINGGGGKPRPLTSGTDDGEESISGQVNEEWGLWKSIVMEAEKMDGVFNDGCLDHETMQRFVSPVTAKMDQDVETYDYLKTETIYQTGLSQEPDNPLLLANYAQFLYLIAHDHKRAEVYFKRASEIEPKDPEALSKYASFLWHAKNDLWAAEETFLEAISTDPSNSFYTAAYANFLWSNGAEDTCFPLESSENM